MTNRITILAILVVVALIGAFAMTHHHAADNNPNDKAVSSEHKKGGKTLEEARENVKNRIAKFEKMTADQWNDELKSHPHRHGTLDEALKRSKDRLVTLNAMSDEDWESQKNGVRQSQPTGRKLPKLGPKDGDNADPQTDDDNQ